MRVYSHRGVTKCDFMPPKRRFLEGGTKDEIRISNEALFKVVSTRFGLRIVEGSIENPDFIFCSSFQNLRLGTIDLPARQNAYVVRY